MINGKQSPDLTSYDILKALALLLMVADHLGYYFWPDDLWWRVAGRLSVPVWFFLIGYARTRAVPREIWLFGGVLVLSSLLSGQYVFPLDILFTLGLSRLLIDGVMLRALRTRETLAGMFFFLFLIGFPAAAFVEYGTFGLLFAMLGYMCRHREALALRPAIFRGFAAGCAAAFFISQAVVMAGLTIVQGTVVAAGLGAELVLLVSFRPVAYPGFARYARTLLPLAKLLGRRTLEIYVIHLLAFQALAMAQDPERFALLDFELFPPPLVAMFTSL